MNTNRTMPYFVGIVCVAVNCCMCVWLPHISAGVLQIVGSQEVFNRLSQVVLQQPSDQLVVLHVQRAVNRRQAAVDGHVRHGVA